MSNSIELGRYTAGDIASLPQYEPDPLENWGEYAELYSHDLRTIRINGAVVACIGYMPTSLTDADAFAVIDRHACKGYGAELVALARIQQVSWMRHTGIVRANAQCRDNDKPAQVFLRAVGFKRVTASCAGFAKFTFTRSD